MNPATLCRLKKEARALLPFWGATAAWMIVPFILGVKDPVPYALSGYLFACVVMGPVCVGHEFSHRTMAVLLAQPVPRRQLWREKLAATGAAILGLSLLLLLLLQLTGGLDEVIRHAAEGDPSFGLLSILVALMVPVMSFCTGPALTLFARNSLGGAAMTFLGPYFLMILGVILSAIFGISVDSIGEPLLLTYALVVGTVYSVIVFRAGWQWFDQLEDAALIRKELALPAKLAHPLAGLAAMLTPKRGGAMANLVRKELRLQQSAFFAALFFIVFWIGCLVAWRIYPAMGVEPIMIIPAIFLCLAVPVTVGIVSTAEERNLGVHEWHLTLPVPAARQWFVKVLVAIVVNAVLGLLLPGLLVRAASWVTGDPRLLEGGHLHLVSPILIANLVLLCAALYSSTAASNGMRALIGTVVVFVACPSLFIPLMDYLGWHHGIFEPVARLMSDVVMWFSPIEHFGRVIWTMIYVGIGALLCWLYALGLANFRRSLDSLWSPIRQMLSFFAVFAILLVGVNILSEVADLLHSASRR